MRIYEMTATFGKLENQKLTLKPGLNIIEAPNEWGKSTWCAFLLAMLYGLDTRAKTTKTALADKERYTPWSGIPMEGRIDLCWQNRDITIERTTRKRIPLGEFKAYETHTGLPVPELTAANCGQLLLGVEQSVFRRAGFIRFSDLPVTQDESLRMRLNDLVTTGDESGSAQKLEQQLKDLKNRCRYNRSGLLPQAQEEKRLLEEKLWERGQLELQTQNLTDRLTELEQEKRQLENHLRAMDYAASSEAMGQKASAQEALEEAAAQLTRLELASDAVPPMEAAQEKLEQLRSLRIQWGRMLERKGELLPEPEEPILPEPFRVAEPAKMLKVDIARYRELSQPKEWIWMVLAAAGLMATVGCILTDLYLWACIALGVAAVFILLSLLQRNSCRRQRQALEHKYGSAEPEQWQLMLDSYFSRKQAYLEKRSQNRAFREVYERDASQVRSLRESLCGEQNPDEVIAYWEQVLTFWQQYQSAHQEYLRRETHYETLSSMIKPAEPPVMEDTLTYSREQTLRALEEADRDFQKLTGRLGQYQGRMEALGKRERMETALKAVDARIAQLEDTYAALTIALETLLRAKEELQRRFAPRISRRAQELLERMTCGDYKRIALGADFSLETAARQEQVLQSLLWRSEGTVDQLYLALRLAVAEELTKDAPLILDDALVRFDDHRLEAALKILQESAGHKQVILFTCQNRENRILNP